MPVALAYQIAHLRGPLMALTAIAPVAGHAFSPFLKFAGGKAVAVTAGIWGALTTGRVPLVGGLLMVVWRLLLDNDSWVVVLMFGGFLLIIGLTNLLSWRKPAAYPIAQEEPMVSILVPARNEEHNISECIQSLLLQSYPRFEVLVLNDHSTDRTAEELQRLKARFPALRIMEGTALAPGWHGKHWACHQLAQQARGDLFLFTDADTRHHPHALREAVNALYATSADLLTAMPRQEMRSFTELLVIPTMPWTIFAFLPLILTQKKSAPAFTAVMGQYMLFRREAYQRIGGYEAVRASIVDDLALGRRVKKHGMRVHLVDGTDRIRCRMYHNRKEVIEGFSKNFYAAFGANPLVFTTIFAILGLVFLMPLSVLLSAAAGIVWAEAELILAGVNVGLALLLWALSNLKSRFPLALAALYPVAIGLAIAIAIRSMVMTRHGMTTWKGRRLQ